MIRILLAVIVLSACSKKEAPEPAPAPQASSAAPAEAPVPDELKPSYLRMPEASHAGVSEGIHAASFRRHLEALGVPKKRIVPLAEVPPAGRLFVYLKSADPAALEALAKLTGEKIILLDEAPLSAPAGLNLWSGDMTAFLKGLNGAAKQPTLGAIAEYAGGSFKGDGSLKLR